MSVEQILMNLPAEQTSVSHQPQQQPLLVRDIGAPQTRDTSILCKSITGNL